MNIVLWVLGGIFGLAICGGLLNVLRARRIANYYAPYNPPKQMYYKNGNIYFKQRSQRSCWWETFWQHF